MHQTFYIDVDEEITSVIDRLRKSKAKENIFVIPQRAIVLQSVINLRLLKKEADKLKRQIMIVSQDEQVRTISEKVGILYQSSMKGIEESEEIKDNLSPKIRVEKVRKTPVKKIEKKRKAEEIGTDSFFEKNEPHSADNISEEPAKPGRENLLNTELIKDIGGIQKKERGIFSEIKNPVSFSISERPAKKESADGANISDILARKSQPAPEFRIHSPIPRVSNSPAQFRRGMDPIKEKSFNEIFRPALPAEKTFLPANPIPQKPVYIQAERTAPASAPVPGKFKKFFLVFGLICLFVALFIGAYLFVPKATVAVQTASDTNRVTLEAIGAADLTAVDLAGKQVPLKIIEREQEKSLSFIPASASNGAGSQKAQGKVTIYNEYSSASQPLVATTRLLTPEGKLFRVVKDVVVPGMSKVGDEEKPGAVEVDAVAEKTGQEFEIGPSTFKIPGFEGGPKYDKFYAKSSDSMKLAEVNSSVGAKGTITSQDIADAKSKLEEELAKEMKERIAGELSSDQVLLANEPEKEILSSASSQSAGKSVENFDYSMKIKMSIAAVSKSDLINIIRDSGKLDMQAQDDSIKIGLVNSQVDYNSKTANFKIQGEINTPNPVDLDKFKSEILGKKEDQIKEILKNYPQIKGVEIDFSPSFFSGRVPRLGQRVEVKTVQAD